MIRVLRLAVVFLGVGLVGSSAQAQYTAQELMLDCVGAAEAGAPEASVQRERCLAYLSGANDMFMMLMDTLVPGVVCPPAEGSSIDDVLRIVTRWIVAQSGTPDTSARHAIWSALVDAYACRRGDREERGRAGGASASASHPGAALQGSPRSESVMPRAVMGIAFGSTVQAAGRACRTLRGQWVVRGESGLCHGPAMRFGSHPITTVVNFQQGRAVGISVLAHDADLASRQYLSPLEDMVRSVGERHGRGEWRTSASEACSHAVISGDPSCMRSDDEVALRWTPRGGIIEVVVRRDGRGVVGTQYVSTEAASLAGRARRR